MRRQTTQFVHYLITTEMLQTGTEVIYAASIQPFSREEFKPKRCPIISVGEVINKYALKPPLSLTVCK